VPTTRSECRILENQFLDRFDRHLQNVKLVLSPLTGATYDLSGAMRREIDQDPEVRALLRKTGETRAYPEMPVNRTVIVQVTKKPLFGARRPVAVLAAASLSPLEELAHRKIAETPGSARDVSLIRDRVVTQPKVFHYLALFSPTGWADEARRDLSGRNYVIALVDYCGGGLRTGLPGETRPYSRKVFDLSPYPEKLDMLRALLRASIHELLVGEFTSEYVEKQLFFPQEVIENLFEDLVVEDKFLILDARSRPSRLIREYARAGFPGFQDIFDQSELLKYRDALDRDEERIQCLLGDLQKLGEREEELLDEGARSPESLRRILAHRIKRLRLKEQELQARLAVFQKRHAITAQYVNTLELIRAVRMEATPDLQKLETMIAQASVAREKLKELVEAAQASQAHVEREEDSPELDRIMQELKQEERGEKETPEPEAEPEPPTPLPEPPPREPERRPEEPRQIEYE
jgi:hypothetical protein